MKKLISLLLSIVLCIGILPLSVWAADEKSEITTELLASDLKSLGLFKGVSATDFALERKPTRTEAIVMLIRVLGKEEVALNGKWEHPFDDVPAWADSYVGYAYSTGLTGGIAATKFGSNNIAPDYMYLTFVLRALGYSDKDGEFVWNSPYTLASDVGILPKKYNKDNFLRGDVVNISYAALNALMKDSRKTLAETLIECGAFTEEEFNSVYRLGAIKLDISPYTEVRKMLRQYGEYDKKTGTYTLFIEMPPLDGEYSSFTKYDTSYTFSYTEGVEGVLLRHDSYSYYVSNDGGKRYESEGTEYYTLRLVEGADTYEVEGYVLDRYVTSGGKTETLHATGEFYPHKWDRNYETSWTWLKFDYLVQKKAQHGYFRSWFATLLNGTMAQFETTMEEYGLTCRLADLGCDAKPYEHNYTDEYTFEGTLSEKEIQQLSEYSITANEQNHTPYSEAAKRYDKNKMHSFYGDRTSDFKTFQEAHEYLKTAFSEQQTYTFSKLNIKVVPTTLEACLNLFASEAVAQIAYNSKNLEVKLHTDEELLYHPDAQDGIYVTARGICEFIIKNKNTDEWSQEDFDAIKKPFNSSPYVKYLSFEKLVKSENFPKYIYVDVHLKTVSSVGMIDVIVLDYNGWDAVTQSTVTINKTKNGTVQVSGTGYGMSISNGDGNETVSKDFYSGGYPTVACFVESGYWISDLIINGKSVGAHFTYPLDITGDDISVSAAFEKIADPVKVTLSVLSKNVYIQVYADGGFIGANTKENTSKEILVPRGAKITVTVRSGIVGQNITEVVVNGENYNIQAEYTFTVTENMTISDAS